MFGPPDSDEFIKAQDAFMRSLAGYSIACYVLQIKDRHNGNLLIDESGHLIRKYKLMQIEHARYLSFFGRHRFWVHAVQLARFCWLRNGSFQVITRVY